MTDPRHRYRGIPQLYSTHPFAPCKRPPFFACLLLLFVLGTASAQNRREVFQQNATEDSLNKLIRTFHGQVLQLEYGQARETATRAVSHDVKNPAVAAALAELLFVYAEAGKDSLALEVLSLAAPGLLPPPDLKDRRAWFRQPLVRLTDSATLKDFDRRYYPRMVGVKGGTYWIGGI